LERRTGEPLPNYKVRDWLNHWLDMKEQVRASKTTARYRQVIRDFIASLGNSANLALAQITPKDVLTYRNSIIKANKTARTANLSLKVVSAALNAALRQGYIPTNPATAVESLPVKSEERGSSPPRKCQSSCGRQMAAGVAQSFSAITPAHGLATWPTCEGTRLIGATK
jgi:integrase-like protein